MSPAATLFAALRARGYVLKVVRGRLRFPKHLYRELTDEERAIVRHNREELKMIANGTLPIPVAVAPTPPPPSPPPGPRPPAPTMGMDTILRSEYPELGLSVVNGIVTHALGDEFAQRILDGDVTRDEAIAMQRRKERDVGSMKSSPGKALIW